MALNIRNAEAENLATELIAGDVITLMPRVRIRRRRAVFGGEFAPLIGREDVANAKQKAGIRFFEIRTGLCNAVDLS